MPVERLQKLLARGGFGSRRSAETLITAGRVTIDGRPALLGERADPATARIEVDGRALSLPQQTVVWMLHKPAGYLVSAFDDWGRKTVYHLLPDAPPGLRYVGRLDRDTEGLLLLTTDGELAHRLAHPRYEVWKTYEADLREVPHPEVLERLRSGVQLEDGVTAPARVQMLSGEPRPRLSIEIREGKKREVRRMLAAVRASVVRLARVAVGPVQLGVLASGETRALTTEDEQSLRALVGLGTADQPATVAALDGVAEPSLSSIPIDDVPEHAAPEAVITTTDTLARSLAIDGPTASGKSVVGRALAERLGLGFVDTGLMYRACTLAVIEAGIDAGDAAAVTALVRAIELDMFWPEPSAPRVTLSGVDVTSALRTPEIERTVSQVSGIPEVRDELVRRQRGLAARSPIVMAGRDIGTRVLTEARTKVFLEASEQVRARRRLGEEVESGRQTNFDRVLDETRRRDEADSTGHRAIRREQAATDALVIDTDALGIDEVVERCTAAYRAANEG